MSKNLFPRSARLLLVLLRLTVPGAALSLAAPLELLLSLLVGQHPSRFHSRRLTKSEYVWR